MPVLLLAEDEPLVSEIVEPSLTDVGFSVVSVPSGAAAIAWLDKGLDCDGLITDIRMGAARMAGTSPGTPESEIPRCRSFI